jgi:hypothetical protein
MRWRRPADERLQTSVSGEGASFGSERLVNMAEEFDHGWYVRREASPFSPTPPMFFGDARPSDNERRLIRDYPSQPKPH